MSDSPSPGGDPEGGPPEEPEGQPPCAELKAAMEKCVKEKGEESCKELMESYHECLRALGIKV